MNHAEARVLAERLVAQMTLEEKASQLRYNAPAIERLGIPEYNWWNEALHGVARAGTATVFPQAIGLAAVFDEAFHQKIADTVATEARAKYNAQRAHGDRDIYKGLTFWSPNINIFRDPRWGRGHETLGEDPYLTSRMGTAYIKGLQGDGEYMKTAACAKHFCVHSGPEAIRHEFDAVATPKDMEETYLPAFESAVREGHVEAVMGAYNRVNGEPACGSKTLLTDILRDKWGFEGHVTSDCWAIMDFHMYHHVTDTAPESAALALKSGCDLNCGEVYLHLLEALQEGLITEDDITEAAVRLFTTRYLLGMFADDCAWDAIGYEQNDTDEHDALAQAAAEKSMVLLKNDGILPLDPEKIHSVAVIGPNAESIRALIGNYHGTSSRYVTLLDGIRSYCREHGIRVFYSEGCPLVNDKAEGLAKQDDRFSEAVACAEMADVVIACVGLDETLEGEQGDASNYSASGDKISLELPEPQVRLMEILEKTGYDSIQEHEQSLLRKVIDGLLAIDGVTVYGDTENISDKIGIVTFNIDGVNYTDVASGLADTAGIDVGKGTFGAQPYVFRLLGVPNTAEEEEGSASTPGMVRVSLGVYNTEEEIDVLLSTVRGIAEQ